MKGCSFHSHRFHTRNYLPRLFCDILLPNRTSFLFLLLSLCVIVVLMPGVGQEQQRHVDRAISIVACHDMSYTTCSPSIFPHSASPAWLPLCSPRAQPCIQVNDFDGWTHGLRYILFLEIERFTCKHLVRRKARSRVEFPVGN